MKRGLVTSTCAATGPQLIWHLTISAVADAVKNTTPCFSLPPLESTLLFYLGVISMIVVVQGASFGTHKKGGGGTFEKVKAIARQAST